MYKPLAGLRVLDFSKALAGPYCTMLLGDLGAEVIKIEHPARGDDSRSWGPPFTKKGHESTYFLSANRNKLSVAIDYKRKAGIGIISDLLERCSVIVENSIVGHFPFSRQVIADLNPTVIWCSITGYGSQGPLATEPGYAAVLESFGGLLACTGSLDQPARMGVAVTDILTGLHANGAILAALHDKNEGIKKIE